MGDSFCGRCGARKRPLAYTTYCPNDCDRIVPRAWKEPEALEFELKPLDFGALCPSCGTGEIEAFPDCDVGDMHCIPGGHVWWHKD